MATNVQEKSQAAAAPALMGRFGHAQSYSEVQRPQKTLETLLRVWFYLRRQKRSLILTALMVVGTVCLDLAGPILLGRVIDGYVVPRNLIGLPRILLLSPYDH